MCKENMELYQQFRECPQEAQKPISAGRLKGKTDINPMWRIKRLTEIFGPCGIGWVCPIVEKWIEESPDTKEKTANVRVQLRYKYKGEWSEAIDGIGGAMFVEAERQGLHADDDCFKKAYTDAISVACKSLGIAADIYYSKDPDTKYSTDDTAPPTNATPPYNPPSIKCADCGKPVAPSMAERTKNAFGVELCRECGLKRSEQTK